MHKAQQLLYSFTFFQSIRVDKSGFLFQKSFAKFYMKGVLTVKSNIDITSEHKPHELAILGSFLLLNFCDSQALSSCAWNYAKINTQNIYFKK